MTEYTVAMREDLSRGKVGIINGVMNLSAAEAEVFWPIYHEYETELFELGNQRIEGMRQFVREAHDGRLDETQASSLSTAYFEYEKKRLELLSQYHDSIAKTLSPVRAIQFVQIEHRVGTVVDLLIASEVPLITGAPAAGESQGKAR